MYIFVLYIIACRIFVSLGCSFLIVPSIFSNVYLTTYSLSCVLCYPMLAISFDCSFLIALLFSLTFTYSIVLQKGYQHQRPFCTDITIFGSSTTNVYAPTSVKAPTTQKNLRLINFYYQNNYICIVHAYSLILLNVILLWYQRCNPPSKGANYRLYTVSSIYCSFLSGYLSYFFIIV